MMRWEFDEIIITTNENRIEFDQIFDYLHHIAYWCNGIPSEVLRKAIDNSVNFSVFLKSTSDEFVGYARLVTDYATFSYLCDVFILPQFRNKGYGKHLITAVNTWIEKYNLRTSLLLTRDAQEFYSQFDWKNFDHAGQVMRYKERNPNFYQ